MTLQNLQIILDIGGVIGETKVTLVLPVPYSKWIESHKKKQTPISSAPAHNSNQNNV